VTVFVTIVTGRSGATVHPLRVVTRHQDCIIDESLGTHEVLAMLGTAVPVLDAVKLVSVPSIRPALADCGGMVVVWPAVGVVGIVVFVTILVTFVTDRSVATGHVFIIVTPILFGVVLLVVFAHVVDPLTTRALPVLPAVPWVSIPTIILVAAVHFMTTIFWGSGRVSTVFITDTADRTVSTVSVCRIVAAHVDQVEQLRLSSGWVIRAKVVGPNFPHTVPVLPAVIRISMNALSELLAVHDVSAVRSCGLRGLGRLRDTGDGVLARTISAVYRVRVRAEFVDLIEEPRHSILVCLALQMRHSSLLASVKFGARLGIGIIKVVAGAAVRGI